MRKNRFCLCVIFSLCVLNCISQNIMDGQHTVIFANYLYSKGDYNHAIVEYNRAWLTDPLSVKSQKELFQSYFFTGKYKDGINIYKSKYPSFLAQNDTLELIYGKLLISSESFSDVRLLIENSKSLSAGQSLFLSLSSDLFSGDWKEAMKSEVKLADYAELNPYNQLFNDIRKIKYKNPVVSLSLSSVLPGLGKAYSGYWKEGLTSFTVIAVTAYQAYRGFSKYGSKPYSWIYASLSASFYLGNLYGSYKAAEKRNYTQKESIRKKFENAYNQMYSF